ELDHQVVVLASAEHHPAVVEQIGARHPPVVVGHGRAVHVQGPRLDVTTGGRAGRLEATVRGQLHHGQSAAVEIGAGPGRGGRVAEHLTEQVLVELGELPVAEQHSCRPYRGAGVAVAV